MTLLVSNNSRAVMVTGDYGFVFYQARGYVLGGGAGDSLSNTQGVDQIIINQLLTTYEGSEGYRVVLHVTTTLLRVYGALLAQTALSYLKLGNRVYLTATASFFSQSGDATWTWTGLSAADLLAVGVVVDVEIG